LFQYADEKKAGAAAGNSEALGTCLQSVYKSMTLPELAGKQAV
jgi:hypothetical protein